MSLVSFPDNHTVRESFFHVVTFTNQFSDGLLVTFLRRLGPLPLQCE